MAAAGSGPGTGGGGEGGRRTDTPMPLSRFTPMVVEFDDYGRLGNPVSKVTGLFTKKTINLYDHLYLRVNEIGGMNEEILDSLWDYDGLVEEDPREVRGPPGPQLLCTSSTLLYWDTLKRSTDEAKRALFRNRDIPRAFSITFATTFVFGNEDHWMTDTEDEARGAELVNGLLELWSALLPKTDEELDIGGGDTRALVAESIRALCEKLTSSAYTYEEESRVFEGLDKDVVLMDWEAVIDGSMAAADGAPAASAASRQQHGPSLPPRTGTNYSSPLTPPVPRSLAVDLAFGGIVVPAEQQGGNTHHQP